jgi:hypothetical protein
LCCFVHFFVKATRRDQQGSFIMYCSVQSGPGYERLPKGPRYASESLDADTGSGSVSSKNGPPPKPNPHCRTGPSSRRVCSRGPPEMGVRKLNPRGGLFTRMLEEKSAAIRKSAADTVRAAEEQVCKSREIISRSATILERATKTLVEVGSGDRRDRVIARDRKTTPIASSERLPRSPELPKLPKLKSISSHR